MASSRSSIRAGTSAAGQPGEVVAPGQSNAGSGRIGELSRDALRYGQELVGLPEPLLAQRLYGYGRLPVCAQLQRRLGNGVAVAAYLGLGADGPVRLRRSTRAGTSTSRRGRRASELARVAPATRVRRSAGPGPPGYKLYISPATGELKAALGAVASSLATARGLRAFKVGANVRGLGRPDKLVVYFERLDDLRAGADTLSGAGGPARRTGSRSLPRSVPTGCCLGAPTRPAGPSRRGRQHELADVGDGAWPSTSPSRARRARPARAVAVRAEPLAPERSQTDTWVPASAMWGTAVRALEPFLSSPPT